MDFLFSPESKQNPPEFACDWRNVIFRNVIREEEDGEWKRFDVSSVSAYENEIEATESGKSWRIKKCKSFNAVILK